MQRGVLFMVLAGLAFTVMITAVKVARQTLHPFELIFWRSLIGTPLVFAAEHLLLGPGAKPLAGQQSSSPSSRYPRPALLLLRSALGFLAMSCIFTAARGLSISDLSVLHKLQPLVIATLAPWLLGGQERAGPVWGALLVGFLGTAVLIGPELRVGNVYGLWALAGATLSALAHLAVRSLGRDHSPFTVVVAFQALCVPLSVIALLLIEGRLPALPSRQLWGPVLLVAGMASLGQLLMTQAYRLQRAAPVAAASYTAPLWGVVVDLLWFSEFPSWEVWLGGGAIVGAGLWLVLWKSKADEASPEPE